MINFYINIKKNKNISSSFKETIFKFYFSYFSAQKYLLIITFLCGLIGYKLLAIYVHVLYT